MSPPQTVEQSLPEGARCANHPDAAATLLCPRCGSFACRACTRLDGARRLCRECVETHGQPALGSTPASRGRRLGNLAIDSLVGQNLVWLPVLGYDTLFQTAVFDAVPPLFGTLVYYLVLEAAFGVTLGKLITRTRVVDLHGRRPSFWQVMVRSLVRCIPFDPLSFLFGEPTGWHDNWSETRVVCAR